MREFHPDDEPVRPGSEEPETCIECGKFLCVCNLEDAGNQPREKDNADA